MKKLYFILIGLFVFSGVEAQIINFPDAVFKAKLISASPTNNFIAKNLSGNYCRIDTNYDGNIQQSEALQISYIEVNGSNITDITGIEYFTNLKTLYCSGNYIANVNIIGLTNLTNLGCANNNLTSLNVSGLTNLQFLECTLNMIPSLNVNGLTSLQTLLCGSNPLVNIDLSTLTNLKKIDCSQDQLTSLNVSTLINLQQLDCHYNQIPNLNISGLNNLNILDCSSNLLSSLNLSGLFNIFNLNCSYNYLSSIDVSALTNLQTLNCSSNQLTSLFIKNGFIEGTLNFNYNTNLQYICADDSQITQVQNLITQYAYTNCHVNSYCSFVPGGTFYTIKGDNRFDEDNNGCSATDINYPNLKLSFTDGTNTGNLIPNATGAYQLDVQAGTQTFTPVLENPTYFTVSPTTASVTFPTTTSPFTQDFCIIATGVHNDLEVTILPIGNARPGFDAHYQIVYKNKGNSLQSGSIGLNYNGAISAYISAIPAVSSQVTNNLSWSFSDLQPFETRTINVTLNINTPTATLPVNAGDILNYTATSSGLTDETPADNVSYLNQMVVNALDPNEKTCTEGTTVSPSMVGQYVHYIIHFENDGTANAQNIVVKDMIDTSKFDINTLVPLTGSANFTTRITNTNQVEFIFQNINLPFTTGTNDGYVAFKIKTKPTLVVGDTFSNTANIYFDYNAPIVTNTATTTIAALANPEVVFSDYFTLSPIPTKEVLNITTKQDITISSISIYNTQGQVILVTSNPSKTIDVSNLATGSYFIKVITDKGTSSGKFIKE